MEKNLIYQNTTDYFIIESLYDIGQCITYEITLKVNNFMGQSNFCIHQSNLVIYGEIIDCMNKNLEGQIIIEDYDSDAYLQIAFESEAALFVSGQLGGSYSDNCLKFKFKGDQTILSSLKVALLYY